MQRKATKQSRAANADEKRFMQYTKECDCIACGAPGPSECDHVVGSSAKIKVFLISVLIGHWFLLPLCHECHMMKTRSKRSFLKLYGPFYKLWLKHIKGYHGDIPEDVIEGIKNAN